MGIVSNLKPPARSAAKPAVANKYGGIKASAPRDPMPDPGEYIFRIESMIESRNKGNGNESVKTTVVAEQSEDQSLVGRRFLVLNIVNGKGGDAGLSRVKSLVMAAAGFVDEDAFDEFDQGGEFISACVGADNEFKDSELLAPGRLVACIVTKGNTTPDGRDFFREYTWVPIDQETCEPITE